MMVDLDTRTSMARIDEQLFKSSADANCNGNLHSRHGLKDEGNLRLFSAEEVAAHKSAEDPWIVVDGEVYNVAIFLQNHPGGADVSNLRTFLFGRERFSLCNNSEYNMNHKLQFKKAPKTFRIFWAFSRLVAQHMPLLSKVSHELLQHWVLYGDSIVVSFSSVALRINAEASFLPNHHSGVVLYTLRTAWSGDKLL